LLTNIDYTQMDALTRPGT